MVLKNIFYYFFFLFFLFKFNLYSNIIYDKNNIIITEFDLIIINNLYKENYGENKIIQILLKDLVVIKNL